MTFVFQFFDEFFDIARYLIASGDQERIVRVDDNEVFDTDGRDETFAAVDEQILASQVDMISIHDGLFS